MTAFGTRCLAPGRLSEDRGDIILSWLSRVVITLGASGLVLFDLLSVGATHLSLPDQASTSARAASDEWKASHSGNRAFAAASASAIEQNPGNTVDASSFRIDPDGTVHVTLHRTAMTLLARHVKPLREEATVSESAVAHPGP